MHDKPSRYEGMQSLNDVSIVSSQCCEAHFIVWHKRQKRASRNKVLLWWSTGDAKRWTAGHFGHGSPAIGAFVAGPITADDGGLWSVVGRRGWGRPSWLAGTCCLLLLPC